jgi:hypothetical protein
MFVSSKRPLTVLALVAFACVAGLVFVASGPAAQKGLSSNVSVFASGLNNPRGLVWGPDRDLYVAEGGTGGDSMTTDAQCMQVPGPVGPYHGGFTARILKFAASGGSPTVVASGLPSARTSALGGLSSGVAALAFVEGKLYALTAGAGCSHGLFGTSNGVLRVNSDGTTTMLANLSQYQASHPVAHPEPDDFEPDGTWYSMIAVQHDLFAVEPNHGEVVRVSPTTGAIHRVVDVSDSQGHIVPTSIAYQDGRFFLGNLGLFPVVPGSEKIFKLTPSGNLSVWADDLSTVLGLALDRSGRLYVLESMTAPGVPGARELGTGKIIRIDHSGARTTIATGLSFPTAMTFGPDGALYVSNLGFGGPGAGQILKVTVPA